jgi:5-hydroxyisourate hydrolase
MSQLTTHILDTSLGRPAANVLIVLYQQDGADWREIAEGVTNKDGRIGNLLPNETILPKGIYKIYFDTKAYFETHAVAAFYPFVEIVFEINSAEHYHVPLLLNPFGYSTYRGS